MSILVALSKKMPCGPALGLLALLTNEDLYNMFGEEVEGRADGN
jgi:hypothetical protein